MVSVMIEPSTTRRTELREPARGIAQVATDFLRLSYELQGKMTTLLSVESREYEIGSSEAIALIALLEAPLPISGVARAAGIRPNGASVLVDRLKSRKLVKRQRSRRDNRVVTVELTDAGRELATTLAARATDQVRFVLSVLTAGEREDVVSLMRRLTDA